MSLSQPLPSMPDSGDTLSEINAAVLEPMWRRGMRSFATRFGWGFYTAICFAVFLLLTFPVDVVLQRVIIAATRGTQLHIRYAQGELTWSGAAVVHDVTIERRETTLLPLKVTRLLVRPSWFGLL